MPTLTTKLTTKDAETIYHIPAATFAEWCREGKLPAHKAGGEWQLAIADIDAFLTANLALRPAASQAQNRVWTIAGAIATVLGFVVDAVALYDIIQGGDRLILWILAGLLSIALWVAAIVVLRAKVRTGIIGYSDKEPIYKQEPRYSGKVPRIAAAILVWTMPTFLLAGVIGYNIWRIIPPKQTVVLLADFHDPNGMVSARVTQSLVDQMRELLNDQPRIHVKRLNQYIPAEGGSQQARAIGSLPEHKAAFVIWGDYTLEPDPELHVHFDILRQTETYLGSGLAQDYGPAQVQQPTMFDFKAKLGAYLGHLTAFASGLALCDAGKNLEAIPLFDTAARAIGQPLANELERPILLYRGTNYLVLGRVPDAKRDLQALVPPGRAVEVLDDIALLALSNLGNVALYQGDYTEAKAYYEQALALHRILGERLNEAHDLGNLGNLAYVQGKYTEAKAYHEQALALHRQLGNQMTETLKKKGTA